MKKKFFVFLVLVIVAMGVGWNKLPSYSYRILVMGGMGFVCFGVLNLYTFRKRIFLRRADKWKLTAKQKKELPFATIEVDEINKKISRGALAKPREIEKLGKKILSPFDLAKIYQIQVTWTGKKKQANLVRKEPWGKLHHWYHLHIYLGLLAFFSLMYHCNFSAGKVFLTQSLFYLLWIVTLSGILGGWINRYLPSMLTKLEGEMTLEQMVYLREKLLDQYKLSLQNLSPQTLRILKSAKKPSRMEKGLAQVDSEEKIPFLQSLALFSEVEKVKGRIGNLKWVHFLLRRWFLFHLPFSIALLTLSSFHALLVLYY